MKLRTLTVSMVAGLGLALVATQAAAAQETIDFNNLAKGDLVTQLEECGGIAVSTNDPQHPAMIFDTAMPSGNDQDLGSPNQTCDIPGPGVGAGGVKGQPYENCPAIALEKVLIISTDANQANPNDHAGGGTITFLFNEAVTLHAVTVMDIDEPVAQFKMYDAGNSQLGATVSSANIGDNGLQEGLSLNATAGVRKLEVVLAGSGAIDNLVCEPEEPGREGCTPGYWKNHAGQEKRNGRFQPDVWPAGAEPHDLVSSVFMIPASLSALGSATLLQALNFGGGSDLAGAAQNLLRSATAAYLNALSIVDYPLSSVQVVDQVNQALANGDRDAILLLHGVLDGHNNGDDDTCDALKQ